MKCPICPSSDLLMTERSGIEIDYCPQCRGVWLDRGELDKIIERSLGQPVHGMQTPQPVPQQYDGRHDHHGKHRDDHQGCCGKQSFWKELFD